MARGEGATLMNVTLWVLQVMLAVAFFAQQNIPDAQLILYPDAGHGALYQYPERFVRHVSMFLSE